MYSHEFGAFTSQRAGEGEATLIEDGHKKKHMHGYGPTNSALNGSITPMPITSWLHIMTGWL